MAITKNTAKPAPAEADKDNLTPATDVAASGAMIEPEIAQRIDVDHPAVDNNPRENATGDMNRIDFNDPTKPQDEAVLDNLGASAAEKEASKKG